jgi:hypothetical protein
MDSCQLIRKETAFTSNSCGFLRKESTDFLVWVGL